MTAKQLFANLGFGVVENNIGKRVTKHNAYIVYQNTDDEVRVSFEQYKGIDIEVNMFNYGADSGYKVATIGDKLVKAIAKQIEEIEKEMK
jgi:hypothetical protein